MRVPRDVSGRELIALLAAEFGYEAQRQRGSHVRLTTMRGGVHHVTVPDHDPIRLGTLNTILGMVGGHFELTRQQVAETLFDKR